jgi:predicted anti-sigma-YlaC factor YlaD
MTCQNCRELLTDYQHGELDAASDAAIFEHLGSCPECRNELAVEARLTESLRAALSTDVDMPTSILAGVRQAVRREKTAGLLGALRVALRPVVLAPTAAVILLIAGVVSHVHSGNSQQLSADYFVRQHVVHTMNSQSGDRAWNAYLLTSATSEDANASGP